MRQGRRYGLSAEQKAEIWRRWKAGDSVHEIGRAFGKDHGSSQPARSPTYTVTAPNNTPNTAPSSSARTVNSGRVSVAGTNGLNPGLVIVVAI